MMLFLIYIIGVPVAFIVMFLCNKFSKYKELQTSVEVAVVVCFLSWVMVCTYIYTLIILYYGEQIKEFVKFCKRLFEAKKVGK